MKMHGVEVTGSNVSFAVIPRPPRTVDEGGQRKTVSGDLVFMAKAVLDFTDFHKLCPRPKPPSVLRPGQLPSEDVEDPDFKAAVFAWGGNKVNWTVLKSLEATETLEWETVDKSNPQTWKNYHSELVTAGFSEPEINLILGAVWEANALDDTKLKEARERFLATR
jgi:hypothetical protein